MKLKMALLSVIFLLSIISIQAQPDCREKFSPYDICGSDYKKVDFVFFGEVLKSDETDSDLSIENKCCFTKSIVEVKKAFKGNPPKKIEIFLDIDIICQGIPPVGSRQSYNVNKTIINGKTRYYSKYISRPITNYSTKALNDVFFKLESVLKNKKENIIEGIIVESLLQARKVKEKNEDADRYILSPESYNPLSNVDIEAINSKTKKVYRTRSKADGTFRFENVPSGDYQLVAVLSDGRKAENDLMTDGSPCQRRQYLIFQPK